MKSNLKFYNNLNENFRDKQVFDLICGNTFQNYLVLGRRSDSEIVNLLKSYTNKTEYYIFYILYLYNKGNLLNSNSSKIFEENIFLKNLNYIIMILENLEWKEFTKVIEKINKTEQQTINLFKIILDNIRRILVLKDMFNLYYKGLIDEAHFHMSVQQYRLNSNIMYLFNKLNFIKYFSINFKTRFLDFKEGFLKSTVGYYDSLIKRYNEFSIYTTSNRTLGRHSRKTYHLYLRLKKRKGNLNYAARLALKYLGKRLKLTYAKKWKNLRYRAYRIFLYTFNMKPFQLWQTTRKNRRAKNGGSLLDHLSSFELTIKNLMLLSNFSLNLQEFEEYLNNKLICVNGKIITAEDYLIKPYDIIHVISEIVTEERNRFLLNLKSAFEKAIFNKQFSSLFEYNFTAYCFTMLPEFLEHKVLSPSPYYNIYNSGRFGVQKT